MSNKHIDEGVECFDRSYIYIKNQGRIAGLILNLFDRLGERMRGELINRLNKSYFKSKRKFISE